MLSAKRIGQRMGLLGGLMAVSIAASAWFSGCGNPNTVVPQAPIGGVAGGYAGCAYGATTYPLSNGYGYGYTCYQGYVFNGSTCVCNSYYNNGYGYGYGNGYNNGYCAAGTIMCSGTCVYTTTGYCPPGTTPGH